MRNIIFGFAFLGISLCVTGEYFIEITPNNEPNAYEMNLGDIVTFEVSAYRKGENGNSLVSFEEKVWWEYDKRLMEKISSNNTSITLKSIGKGTTALSVTTKVKNNHCQKKISILIK